MIENRYIIDIIIMDKGSQSVRTINGKKNNNNGQKRSQKMIMKPQVLITNNWYNCFPL